MADVEGPHLRAAPTAGDSIISSIRNGVTELRTNPCTTSAPSSRGPLPSAIVAVEAALTASISATAQVLCSVRTSRGSVNAPAMPKMPGIEAQ